MGLERSPPARGAAASSGDEGRGVTTHGGRDTAKVDSPPLREHLGCSGRHVLDAMHWGDRCHHQAYRDRAYRHVAHCRLVQWEIQGLPPASTTAPTAVRRSALRSGPEARLVMAPRASSTRTVGVDSTRSRLVRSIRSAASISTNETPSRSLATSVSSALVGPQYAHTSVENC